MNSYIKPNVKVIECHSFQLIAASFNISEEDEIELSPSAEILNGGEADSPTYRSNLWE